MKFSKSFWGVVAGTAVCLLGTIGVAYFQQDWGGADFWRWFPISVIAVGFCILVIIASLVCGFVSGLLAHFRRRHEKPVA
jgi:hypothetical protein